MLVFLLLLVFQSASAQESARILESSVTYTIESDHVVWIEEHTRILIRDEGGYSHSVFNEFSDKFRKVDQVTVEIFDAKGQRVKKLRRGDGYEVGFNPSYEINDAKVLVINPQYKSYPFTVSMTSRVKMNGFISLPPWVPRSQFNVGVDQSSLAISYPESMQINFREEKVQPVVTKADGRILRSYRLSQLEAVAAKFRYRDFFNEQPKVYITPMEFRLGEEVGSNASWTDFGNWFVSLNSEPYVLTADTQAFLKKLEKNDSVQAVRKIYEYMQDKTRYVSIQLGIGGFKSLPTEEVEQFGYGDCKALSTYMKNMLDFAGIKSNYILVRAGRDEPDVFADFPGNQFNHVFIGVPMKQDTLLLECTSQDAPFDYIGSFTDDRNVLWIEKDKSQIIRSRAYSHTESKIAGNWHFTLDKQGNAKVKVNATNQGIFFDELMLYQSAPSEYVAEYNHSKFEYDDFAIKDFKVKKADRGVPEFNAEYILDIKGLARETGDKLMMPSMPARKMGQYILSDDLMKYCSVKRGLTITDHMVVDLPTGYWAYNLPAPEQIETKFGTYKIEMKLESNQLIITRTCMVYKGDYRNEEYNQARAFFQRIEKLETKKLVLNSKT